MIIFLSVRRKKKRRKEQKEKGRGEKEIEGTRNSRSLWEIQKVISSPLLLLIFFLPPVMSTLDDSRESFEPLKILLLSSKLNVFKHLEGNY